MSRPTRVSHFTAELDAVLASVARLPVGDRELVLQAALKYSRERRYFDRSYQREQIWRPVIRNEYAQYLISDWGFVRHKNKSESNCLRPSFGHEYARAPLKAPHRDGASQLMIHELVIEAFVLDQRLPPKSSADHTQIINHIDGDKYNPSLWNLEITDQSSNLKHAYDTGLRASRD